MFLFQRNCNKRSRQKQQAPTTYRQRRGRLGCWLYGQCHKGVYRRGSFQTLLSKLTLQPSASTVGFWNCLHQTVYEPRAVGCRKPVLFGDAGWVRKRGDSLGRVWCSTCRVTWPGPAVGGPVLPMKRKHPGSRQRTQQQNPQTLQSCSGSGYKIVWRFVCFGFCLSRVSFVSGFVCRGFRLFRVLFV